MRYKFLLILVVIISSCSVEKKNETAADDKPVVGLDGRVFSVPEFSIKAKARLDSNLAVAQKNFDENPSEENYIWLGRRQAYLYQYSSAIKTFSEGIDKFPESYKLFRHRGHRYITTREFDKALADLQQAASMIPQALELEPDGQPNKINKPLSTAQFNVWYHLGLAHYLKGDFVSASKAYAECMKVSNNDDLICATADWLYMTYQKIGMKEEAQKVLDRIPADSMNIIENDSYYLRLQMYKELIPPDDLLKVSASNEDVDLALATQGYGVGNWYLTTSDTTRAVEIFNQVVSGKHFAAFGFIAAEAELQRLTRGEN
jgi:tetratricopeptide (TPR) repeat protein